jgi:DNA-binding protein HU-beta
MTKADLVDEIAQRTGLTKKDVADTVDEFLEAGSRALMEGKHIETRGFGASRALRGTPGPGTRFTCPPAKFLSSRFPRS